MVSIANQMNAAAAAAQAQVQRAADAVANGVNKAGNAVAHAAKVAGHVLSSPEAQRDAFAKVRNGIDTAYTTISTSTNNANKKMENEGEATLRTPISAMKDLHIERLEISETHSTNQKATRRVANKLIGFHENVVRTGESVSRTAGDKAHALTSFALTPVRFIAKLLQVEVAGALIQNSIALAVGFAVRGIVLALSQLAHIAPYALAAAVVGGIGAGLGAIAVHVSPIAAVATGIGLVMLGQQAQLAVVSRDVHKLANAVREDRQTAAETTVSARAKQLAAMLARGITVPASLIANGVAKNKGKAATAAVIGGLAAGAYFYGVPTVVTDTLSRTGSYLASFFSTPVVQENVATASQVVSTFEKATGRVVTDTAKAGLEQLMTQGSTGIASMDAAKLLKNGSHAIFGPSATGEQIAKAAADRAALLAKEIADISNSGALVAV